MKFVLLAFLALTVLNDAFTIAPKFFALTSRIECSSCNRLKDTRLFVQKRTKENSKNAKGDGIRQYRVARSLRDELSDIISNGDIKATTYPSEGLLRATSIVDVDLSPDLSFAKVYISVLGNSVEKRQVFVWLCENVGQVRYSLAQRLSHMRRIPDIFFKLSDSQANADLVSLIESISPKDDSSEEEEYEFDEE
jgi:ribosome-binding factor A